MELSQKGKGGLELYTLYGAGLCQNGHPQGSLGHLLADSEGGAQDQGQNLCVVKACAGQKALVLFCDWRL